MQGQLFTQDFLQHGLQETPPARAFGAAELAKFEAGLRAVYAPILPNTQWNESQTEQEIIQKVLGLLGWQDFYLPQVNMDLKGRESVPDFLLFAHGEGKAKAMAETTDDQRYRFGIAIVESKRWNRPLDRGDIAERFDPDAPSSQMLRYLSRADVASDRAIKWGVLTNGAVWRLYWQDARSRAEEFFEVDIALALGLPGTQMPLDPVDPAHVLRLFALLFGRNAFLPQEWDGAGRSLHVIAKDEARRYEAQVSQGLGDSVFHGIFAQLARALAEGDVQKRTDTVGVGRFLRHRYTDGYLSELRDATLVFLYRLLFLFYAEDRNLLPVHEEGYGAYSVRQLRLRVRDDIDAKRPLAGRFAGMWQRLEGAFQLIDQGDDLLGMPAYNGGLFDRSRAPILARSQVPDAVLAPIIDTLSRGAGLAVADGGGAQPGGTKPRWINYRDLSVAHLGSIYERLLEYQLVHEVQAYDFAKDHGEIDRLYAMPTSFARKVSGSYYTHDDLVRLILRESVGLLATEAHQAFTHHVDGLRGKRSLNPADWDKLDAQDPATAILNLRICDPAMGSGHFLVSLVDDLADRVLEAITRAEALVNGQPWAAAIVEAGRPWQSPVVARVADIRRTIKQNAQAHNWRVTDAQLDDRHIVRRMVLKKSVFGVDKNAMAVELAKTALWLHTFTVGAPLSFLDHHLKAGDSLHGEQLGDAKAGLQALGALLMQGEFARLDAAAESLDNVAELTDVDIAEAKLSKQLAEAAAANIAPLHAMLDFWRAMRWIVPGWPAKTAKGMAKLFKDPADKRALGLARVLQPDQNIISVLNAGKLSDDKSMFGDDGDPSLTAANALMAEVRSLAQRERFFHWWTQFPGVFGTHGGQGRGKAHGKGGGGGFDAVIGNPPWDRIKLQEVEWFAERDPAIAKSPRAADRKAAIAKLEKRRSKLWSEYQTAVKSAEDNARVLAKAGDFPLLGGGDVNLYSMFVERAQALVRPGGVVALLTPSGIAADKGAAAFFSGLSQTGRLGALFDFENKKTFFPDVHASFKFSALLFGGPERRFAQTRCAFYLHSLDEIGEPGRTLHLTADDFARVNPNTGAAPVFRHQRDADLTLRLYAQHPVLVRHARADTGEESATRHAQRAWPVKYARMFDMTNDSGLFLKPEELESKGWKRAPLNRWVKEGETAVPLYVGRMMYHFDHRAASVSVNEENLKVASGSNFADTTDKQLTDWYPQPQYWVPASSLPSTYATVEWALGFRDITNATNERTMVSAIVPGAAAGNTLPLLLPEEQAPAEAAKMSALMLANFNAFAFDYIARQKAQGTHLNWYIVEQLPVISADKFDLRLPAAFAKAARDAKIMNGHHAHPTVADFVVPQVLALSYTAHDLAPFARDLGYVDSAGNVLPPIVWDEENRHIRRAALDALFFWLYGLNAHEARTVLNTFPIVRADDERTHGCFRTLDSILAWLAHCA